MLTVLMAVYNGERFIRLALESVLQQTHRDFRLLVVDDASTDSTREIVRSFEDDRVDLLSLPGNVGQTAALNIGLRRATTPWIARMDADDYSHPERLKRQMEALEREGRCRCVGTAIWEFTDDPEKSERVRVRPQCHEEIWQATLHGSGMIHGSIVIEREALLSIGGYDERYRYAADRELFIRFFSRYRGLNLPEPLLGVRRHPQQDSFSLGAANEYVQIFARHLASEGYPAGERTVLRRSLAYSHLFRADCHRRRGSIGEAWGDQLQALRIAPETCARSWVGRLVPRPIAARLRKNFWSPS